MKTNANNLFFLAAGLSLMVWGSCENAMAQQTQRTNAPRLPDDRPKTNVPRLPDGPKPTHIRLVDDPDPSDLLDITFPGAQRPKAPNAGLRVWENIPMDGSFTFDRKISFRVSSPEGSFNSYFYLNTHYGYSMMDAVALRQWIPIGDGKMTQLLTATGDFYQYTDSKEGKYSMIMGSGLDQMDAYMLGQTSLDHAGFKKTGKKESKGPGVPFTRLEYRGKDPDGNTISLWLSDPLDIRLDNNKTYLLTGHFGLGYFTDEKTLKNYMITGLESKEGAIFMTANEKASASFSGKGYTPMGNMMMGGMAGQDSQMLERMNEAKAQISQIEDPQMRALAMKELEQMSGMVGIMENASRKMGETNDLRHLGEGMQQLGEQYSVLQHTLLQSQQATRQMELNIAELRKQGNDDYTRAEINKLNCLISCNRRKERILEQAIENESTIKTQYKNEEDERDELLGNLYEKSLKQMNSLADCGCND